MLASMKRDIEHVVTSTAMFVIAFIVSSEQEKASVRRRRARRPGAPGLIWFAGVSLLVGALVWTSNIYVQHVAFCSHLRLSPPPAFRPVGPPPMSPEVIDLTALGIEALLLTALVIVAIRMVRRRRRLGR